MLSLSSAPTAAQVPPADPAGPEATLSKLDEMRAAMDAALKQVDACEVPGQRWRQCSAQVRASFANYKEFIRAANQLMDRYYRIPYSTRRGCPVPKRTSWAIAEETCTNLFSPKNCRDDLETNRTIASDLKALGDCLSSAATGAARGGKLLIFNPSEVEAKCKQGDGASCDLLGRKLHEEGRALESRPFFEAACAKKVEAACARAKAIRDGKAPQ